MIPYRFQIYGVAGLLLLAIAIGVTRTNSQRAQQRQKFFDEREQFHQAWNEKRPLPAPLHGFNFEPQLTGPDLRFTASNRPFPPNNHVAIQVRNDGQFKTDNTNYMTFVHFDRNFHGEVSLTSEELARKLIDAFANGIPDGYSMQVTKCQPTPESPVLLTSTHVSLSEHTAVFMTALVDVKNRSAKAAVALRESFPDPVDTATLPAGLLEQPTVIAE